MSDTGWTPTRVDTLSSLWRDGLSASQVAKALGGVTRNAVIGKVHRLGLSGRVAGGVVRRPATPRPPRPSPIRVARSPSPQLARPVVALVEPPEGPGLVSRLEQSAPTAAGGRSVTRSRIASASADARLGTGPDCGGHTNGGGASAQAFEAADGRSPGAPGPGGSRGLKSGAPPALGGGGVWRGTGCAGEDGGRDGAGERSGIGLGRSAEGSHVQRPG